MERGGEDECWPWIAGKVSGGYGQLRIEGRAVYAHRLASELTDGPLGSGEVVRHSCDNPPCCNPRHLVRGTQGDNVRDALERGRHRHVVYAGSANGNAKLTDEIVAEIRRREQRETQMSLAKEFNVSVSLVNAVVNGHAWTHLPLARPQSIMGEGLCGCGCGRETAIARMTNAARGHVKGEPVRFIQGHHFRIRRKEVK